MTLLNDSIESVTLASIIESSHDHLMVCDAQGNIIAASSTTCAVYGMTEQQFEGKNVQELESHGFFTPSVTLKVIASHKTEHVLQTTPTGRRVIAEGTPVFYQGKLIRVVSRSRDTTDLEEAYCRLQRQLDQQLRNETPHPPSFDSIEASTPDMLRLVSMLARVAKTSATIVLLGESGVGKTSLARAVHQKGINPEGPFVELNCASIPDSLFEAEMFGYVSGAFSGASSKGKPGLIEQANGGTLFLDEIGELSLPMQSKLLKVLQDSTVVRLGDTRSRKIDFRLIVATHQDLAKRVKEGSFRLDLYYRLNVIPAWVPPLRERREEIPALVNRQRERIKQRYGTSLVLDPDQWGYLMSHDWPGNVRELENYLDRLSLMGDALPSSELEALDITTHHVPEDSDDFFPQFDHLDLAIHTEALEIQLLKKASKKARTTRGMSELLGISQPSVVRKMAKYNLVKS